MKRKAASFVWNINGTEFNADGEVVSKPATPSEMLPAWAKQIGWS